MHSDGADMGVDMGAGVGAGGDVWMQYISLHGKEKWDKGL